MPAFRPPPTHPSKSARLPRRSRSPAAPMFCRPQSATVTSTLVGRQLHELPFTSRNLTELIVTQPGSATPGVPRSTSVYGLPQSALNVTLDGINIQDNSNKSSDGFFNAIFPRADSIEEMTVTARRRRRR